MKRPWKLIRRAERLAQRRWAEGLKRAMETEAGRDLLTKGKPVHYEIKYRKEKS